MDCLVALRFPIRRSIYLFQNSASNKRRRSYKPVFASRFILTVHCLLTAMSQGVWFVNQKAPLSQVLHSAPASDQTISSLRLRENYIFVWNSLRFEGEVRQVVSVQFGRVLVEIGAPAWCISFVLVLRYSQFQWQKAIPFRTVLKAFLFLERWSIGNFKTPGMVTSVFSTQSPSSEQPTSSF